MSLAGMKKENPINALFAEREFGQSGIKTTKVSTLLGTPFKKNTPIPAADPNFVEGDLTGLKTGDHVQHQRFGKGVVTAMDGETDSLKATVNFEGLGEKKLVLKFAKMRILGDT